MGTRGHPSTTSTRKLILAAAAGAGTLVVGALIAAALVFEFGWFDIAAGDAHLPFVRTVVHGVMVHAVGQRAPHAKVPASVPAGMVVSGLCEYREHCQMCHGAPGTARDEWASGLNPPPPYLIDARGRWNPSELYWIIGKGVKMTAMPSWKMSMDDQQIWSIVAYLENMPRIPTAAYRKWAAAGICPNASQLVAAMAGPEAPPPATLPQLPRGLQQQLANLRH